jgi:allantoate deiminase
LAEAIHAENIRVHHLPSGAGHDGMAIIAIAPVAMLFVRCAGGISHNPAEAVTLDDVDTAVRVFARFIERFTPPHR